MEKQRLVIIAGPTAVGKTGASIRLASKRDGEIVSADSMQVYKRMDIGTAKVRVEEMKGIPHHLIDVIEPSEDYNVVRFKEMAKKAVADISSRGKLPIICGGTGFYIQALLYDIDFTEEPDTDIREKLCDMYREKGELYMHELLRKKDPESAEKIPVNNVKRVIRAIEFYELHGRPISEHNRVERLKESVYDSRFFVLTDDRSALYERINKRVDDMVKAGLFDEAEALIKEGIPRSSTAMQGIGYREAYAYLSGEITRDEAIELIKRNSRHYAKRQLTWFRREKNVIEINISKCGDIENEFEKYLW